jgi:hypothetical protein
LELDDGEKIATDYLQKKLSPKRIKTMSARLDVLRDLSVIIVGGWLENQDGSSGNFEVTVGLVKGQILSWKVWSR